MPQMQTRHKIKTKHEIKTKLKHKIKGNESRPCADCRDVLGYGRASIRHDKIEKMDTD